MIWFTCKQCKKTHGRPEGAAGTVVFCDCGHGNLVPWESTIAEPAVLEEVLPVGPALDPLKFDPVVIAGGVPAAEPVQLPVPAIRDPNNCFNHETIKHQAACIDCGEKFCRVCLVYVQGQPLCGPCKNHRVRTLHRPLPTVPLAWWSVAVAFFAGPLVFCLYPFGSRWGLLAILPQVLALTLGALAVRRVLATEKATGLALAVTGILASLFAAFLTLFITFYAHRFWV